MSETFSWTDIDDIAIELAEKHPDRNPLTVRFTELRAMVEGLEGFAPEPGQQVNEQILEAIQAAWHEEAQDIQRDEDEDEPRYKPHTAFRPDKDEQ